MKIKKYEVADMKEALRQIKEELGPNAVILNTKKVMRPMGAAVKALLEVTAAVDYDNVKKTPVRAVAKPRAKVEEKTAPFTEDDAEGSPVYSLKSFAPQSAPKVEKPQEDADLSALLAEFNTKEDNSLLPKDETDIYVPPKPSKADELLRMLKGAELDKLPLILEGIESLKKEVLDIRRLMDNTVNISVDLPEKLKNFYNILVRNGLDELVSYRFLKNLEKTTPEVIGKAQLKSIVEQELANLIPVERDFLTALNKKTLAFIGPTGVGKTTTIAKVAAMLVLKYNVKVCLITSDNFRIGAIDQLKTYADIVRLPLYVATTGQELSDAIKNAAEEFDYILLDSTGRSPYDTTGVSDACEMLSALPTLVPALVLSLAANHRELSDMYERYAGFTPEYIIFTKLDETRYFGPLASLSIKKKTPLLFCSTGQGVPDDMEIPNGKKIAKKLLQEIPSLWNDN